MIQTELIYYQGNQSIILREIKMSIYYYLFSVDNKECLTLGCKGTRLDSEYEGPIYWLEGQRYYLPERLLKLLIERFYKKNGSDKVHLLREDELYDSGEYLDVDDVCIQVGSDEDDAPPLSKYLPELNDEIIQKEIKEEQGNKVGCVSEA